MTRAVGYSTVRYSVEVRAGRYVANCTPVSLPRRLSLWAVLAAPDVAFTDPVIERIERIPIAFIRAKVRKGLVAYASSHNLTVITSIDMDAAIAGSGRAVPAWAQS